MNKTPKSVPEHIVKLNPDLWTVPAENIDWKSLDLKNNYIISGSAFIDLDDLYGVMGNPFSVIIGNEVKDIELEDRYKIIQKTGTPETVFINSYSRVESNEGKNFYKLNVTVCTPMRKELGACAHGFTGAIQTLLNLGLITSNSEVLIETTLNTKAHVFISASGVIALQFEAQEKKEKEISHQDLQSIFGMKLFDENRVFPILSVGSPKLIIELSKDTFMKLQKNLQMLDYEKLLDFENKLQINGIHLFCRDIATHLPEKCMQVNAYLGKENMIDLATGVSNAAQISSDDNVKENQELTITQYAQNGPSAILSIQKKSANLVNVGGTAVLFNLFSL